MWLWEKTSVCFKMPLTKDASVRMISNTKVRRPYIGPLSPPKILIFSLQGVTFVSKKACFFLEGLYSLLSSGGSRWCCSVDQSCLTLRPHRLQRARLPCPSASPRVCSNSRPLSCWCHPTISSSVALFSSCPPSFASLESFPRWQKRVAI